MVHLSILGVGSCDGVVGMSHLVLQHVETVMVHLPILGVGSYDGVDGMSHLLLQPVVAVMCHYVPCYCGVF